MRFWVIWLGLVVAAWGAEPGKATLVVIGYDDSELPANQEAATVIVTRKGREVTRLDVMGGWPRGLARETLLERFGDVAADKSGAVARAVIDESVAADGTQVDVRVEVTRRSGAGRRIGRPTLDRLSTRPLSIVLSGGTLHLDGGRLTQELALNYVRIAAPTLPAGATPITPFFTLHHQQAETVVPLVLHQGGPLGFDHLVAQPDGSWLGVIIGPGSFFIGAYGLGYGEVKSTGFVVRKVDVETTRTFDVEAIALEPMRWGALEVAIESTLPPDRMIDGRIELNLALYARDPRASGRSLEPLKPRYVYAVRPTHAAWLVGSSELPPPAEAPFGLDGPTWTPALALLMGDRGVTEHQGESVTPSACHDRGARLDEHDHTTGYVAQVVTQPPGFERMVFLATPSVLREFEVLVDGVVHSSGEIVPEDVSGWSLEHERLTAAGRERRTAEVTGKSVRLTPMAVTRVTVRVDPTGAKEPELVVTVSEPSPLAAWARDLARPAASLSRAIAYPPELRPSLETLTLSFAEPVDPRTVIVDLGPSVARPKDSPTIRASRDGRVVEVSYELMRLPEGVVRTIALRAGVGAIARDVRPTTETFSWRVEGDAVVEVPARQ